MIDLGPIEDISLAHEPRDLALPEWGWEFDRLRENERHAKIIREFGIKSGSAIISEQYRNKGVL